MQQDLDQIVHSIVSNPSAPTLSLDNLGLDTAALVAILPYLESLQNLSSLSLTGNHLATIPNKFNTLAVLTNIDISNNPFSNLIETSKLLATMPSLKALTITCDAEESTAIPLLIPTLTVLNGKPVASSARRHKPNHNPKAHATMHPRDPDVEIDLESVEELFEAVKVSVMSDENKRV